MLIEILTFFAVASALAVLVCLRRGAPAWPWPVGGLAALMVLAGAGFATALMNKDLGLAMDAVNSTGSVAPLGSHAADIYAKFATTNADKDFSAIIETLRG